MCGEEMQMDKKSKQNVEAEAQPTYISNRVVHQELRLVQRIQDNSRYGWPTSNRLLEMRLT
jgi:hypothetical protein